MDNILNQKSVSANNRAINAVWYLDSDVIKDMISHKEITSDMLVDVTNNRYGYPIPLHWIVKFCDYVLSVMDKSKVADRINRLKQIKELFKTELDICIDAIEVPFHEFCNVFGPGRSNDFTIESETGYTRKELYKRHCKKIDLDLYIECYKVNLAKIRELVNQGANCDALIPFKDNAEPKDCAYWLVDLEFECALHESGLPGGKASHDFFMTVQFDEFICSAGCAAILDIIE